MKQMLLTAILLVSGSVFAASTGTLFISGTVISANDIVITPNANATNLNITAGESNKLVASVAETSNNLLGYKIFMKSAFASKLQHSVDSSKFAPYTVSYNGAVAVTLTSLDQQVKNVSSLSGLTTNTSNVNVNVTAYPLAPAGLYSDTITISIVAN